MIYQQCHRALTYIQLVTVTMTILLETKVNESENLPIFTHYAATILPPMFARKERLYNIGDKGVSRDALS